jgi:hypothetical protein
MKITITNIDPNALNEFNSPPRKRSQVEELKNSAQKVSPLEYRVRMNGINKCDRVKEAKVNMTFYDSRRRPFPKNQKDET